MVLVQECNKPWYSWFSTAHCDVPPVEAQVSLLQCFIDKYYYYYIECPIKLYSSTLSMTAGQITGIPQNIDLLQLLIIAFFNLNFLLQMDFIGLQNHSLQWQSPYYYL